MKRDKNGVISTSYVARLASKFEKIASITAHYMFEEAAQAYNMEYNYIVVSKNSTNQSFCLKIVKPIVLTKMSN